MIKALTSYLDYGFFAEVSVVIFAVVFVSIVIRTLLTHREITNSQAAIVMGTDTLESENQKDASEKQL